MRYSWKDKTSDGNKIGGSDVATGEDVVTNEWYEGILCIDGAALYPDSIWLHQSIQVLTVTELYSGGGGEAGNYTICPLLK